MRFLIRISILLSILSGCHDRINLDFNRVDKRLVIEGTITNTDGPYYINLSYPAKYTYKPDSTGSKARRETGALVSVVDDLGNEYIFKEDFPGLYVSDKTEFKGIVGRSYVLHINTVGGKVYKSRPERLNDVSTLDSLYYEIVDGEYMLYIDMHDPPGFGNYYQWRVTFNDNQNDWIDILPDDYIDGNYLKRFLKDQGNYSKGLVVGIDQLSITQGKYKFLYALDEQINNGGTPFDSPSAPIVGNVYSEKDSTDYALGYFGAAAVSSKSVTIK